MLAKGEIFLRVAGLAIAKFLNWVELMFKFSSQDRAAIYRVVGKKCIDRGNLDEAILSLKTAIDLNASNPDPENYFKLGLAHSKKGSWDDALESFGSSLEYFNGNHGGKDFDKAEIHYRIAVCYDKKDLIDEAIGSCRNSLEISSERAEVHFRLGSLYDKKKEHDRSIKAYKTAIEIDPQRAKYYYSLGLAYDAGGNHEDAIDSLRKAMEVEEIVD